MEEQQLTNQRWGIVGSGMLGMTLAYRLAERGADVTLYENADEVGGLASTWQLGEDDIVWDKHYHVICLSDLHLRTLLDQLNLTDEIAWVETRTGFYTDSKLYSLSNTLEFLRFPPLDWLSKLRLGGTIYYASRVKNWKRLEHIPATTWLRRLSGRRTYEKIWLPLLRAKLGENYTKASAAFIWATIARMYAARRTGLKKEMFGYVRGGYARILERFIETLAQHQVSIKLGHRVRNIRTKEGTIQVAFNQDRRETVDRLVVTVPAPVTANICQDLAPNETSRLKDVQYQGIVCASVLLKKPLAGFYVTNITDSDMPFTAVIEMTALVHPHVFRDYTLVYLPKYVPASDPFLEVDDEEVQEQFLAGLMRMYPNIKLEDVVSFRTSRVRYVMAIPTLDYSESVPPVVTSIPGVYVVNSAQIVNGTLNVNETVQLAERSLALLVETPYRPRTSR